MSPFHFMTSDRKIQRDKSAEGKQPKRKEKFKAK